MYPFFISAGPAFKKNYKIKNFKNVDIYPLMCHILGNNYALDYKTRSQYFNMYFKFGKE